MAIRSCLILSLAWLAAAASPAASEPLPAFSSKELNKEPNIERFEDRSVRDVLLDFNRLGYKVVFSSDLVRPGMRFGREPPAGPRLDQLKLALQNIGLALKPFPKSNAWLVVRHQIIEPETVDQVRVVPKPMAPLIEEVVVTFSRHVLKRHNELSRHSLSADEFNAIPELGEDALRAVNHLPGAASLGVSARPHIRGGDRDETLVLFNQIELVEPFHLKGFESLFSSFNPALIERIDVYTGGFPARYGDRMSGVMDIQPVADYPPLGGELALSVLTTSAAVYGSNEDRQWALSGRRGNLDLLTEKVNPELGRPSYSDWMGLATLTPDDERQIDLGFLLLDDDIRIQQLEDGGGELARSSYRNVYVWGKYGHTLSDKLDRSTSLSYGRIRHRRGGFSEDDAADETTGIVEDRRRFDLFSLTHRVAYQYRPQLQLEYGLRMNYQQGRYDYFGQANLGALSQLLGSESVINRHILRDVAGWSGGLFASAQLHAGAWQWEAGLRLDYQGYGKDDLQIGPRLNVAYTFGDRTVLTFAAGRFFQPEAITELQVEDGRDRFQKPQHADHFIVGLQHRFRHPGWRLSAEAFFKRIQDPKARYENLFNRLVLLPEIKPDRVLVQPSIAYARGVEVTLSYDPHPDFRFWFSYSGSRAKDQVHGHYRLRSWDQAHTLQAGIVWNRSPYSFSALGAWHSGWQTTELPTYYATLEPLDLRHNDGDLPAFFSLDMRFSRVWQWPRQSLSVFAEITNATHANNVGGYQHELAELEGGGYELLTDDRALLPLVPSIGLQWKFH